MGAAIRDLDEDQTLALTRAMLDSGDRWRLSTAFPNLVDKHSTGGVGDTISLVLAPLLAAVGLPVVMLTGRALGHTAGTADKLESIPGLEQELDRDRALRLLEETGMAIGVATRAVAPADRRLYALRHRTATIDSLPLIVASILSKKLATGAAAIVFDVKTGDGAFLPDATRARDLARRLVELSRGLGVRAAALLTDMDQPLGEWAGHAAEVREALDCLEGGGPRETVELTLALAAELVRLVGAEIDRAGLEAALADGRARQAFVRWAVAQGADAAWFDAPRLDLAPVEVAIRAARSGVLCRVATRRLGELLGRAAGSDGGDEEIDRGVALRYRARLGQELEGGEEIARVYLRDEDAALVSLFESCFEVGDEGEPRRLVIDRID